MVKAERFKDLVVWQEAHKLVLKVYRVTKDYPSDERFGIVLQMRRAAVSIAANIAEGFKKRGLKDKIKFYNISQGSLEELRYYFILFDDLGYLRKDKETLSAVDFIGRMLTKLIGSLRVA